MDEKKRVVVLGATGYVGGRLVPKLASEGYNVRACGRSIQKLKSRPWADDKNVELCEVDVFDFDSLIKALFDADVVYYLVHSMNPQSQDFVDADRQAAENMAQAGEKAGIKRIIYLGGLGEDGSHLSKHLKSRHEVAEVLAQGKVPVTTLRAAMIIGSGSASFEILRYLVDRLPIMVTPRWVQTPNQPIAIRNVIEYLFGCLQKEETAGRSFDIGGKEVLSYLDLMRIYAEVARLPKRIVIPVPVLTPKLSSLWIHLVTPVPSYIAQPLAEGLTSPVVCQNDDIQKIIPQDILGCREAIERALTLVLKDDVKTYWADAGEIPKYATRQEGDAKWAGGTLLKDKREKNVQAPARCVWEIVSRIGGDTGWYHGTKLWTFRGFLDRLVGGVGLRRGRRSATEIAVGDVIDFWRVASVQTDKQLLLVAEMKLPGRALLEFKIIPQSENQCTLIQEARFYPQGLFGLIYWYGIFLLHEYVFGGMIKKISRLAELNSLKNK